MTLTRWVRATLAGQREEDALVDIRNAHGLYDLDIHAARQIAARQLARSVRRKNSLSLPLTFRVQTARNALCSSENLRERVVVVFRRSKAKSGEEYLTAPRGYRGRTIGDDEIEAPGRAELEEVGMQ